jgi:hypothetical protein
MATRRDTPYVWLTWLIKLLSGEEHCYWHRWFQAHHDNYEKAESDFDRATWQADHAAMVAAHAKTLREQGYTVTIEKQNTFRMRGRSGAVFSGQPDLVAIKGDELLMVDCKSGKPHANHRLQVLLYLLLWGRARPQHADLRSRGEIVYSTRPPIPVSAAEADESFMQQFLHVIRELVADEEPARVPSYAECSRCELSCNACPAKVVDAVESVHVDFF